MKILLLCVCVLAAAGMVRASDVTKGIAEEVMATEDQVVKCMEKTDLTEENLKTLDETRDNPDEELLAKFGCFMACVAEEQGTLVNGEFDLGKMKEIADDKIPADMKETLMSIVETCVEKVKGEENACVKMLNFAMCFEEEMQK